MRRGGVGVGGGWVKATYWEVLSCVRDQPRACALRFLVPDCCCAACCMCSHCTAKGGCPHHCGASPLLFSPSSPFRALLPSPPSCAQALWGRAKVAADVMEGQGGTPKAA